MSQTIIVIPCFNEGHRLEVGAFRGFDDPSVEFLFVDDGSTDDTPELLGRIVSSSRHSMLRLDKNVGKGEAVRQGILAGLEKEPDLVGFFDADLAAGLDEIRRFVDLLTDRTDLLGVIGSRVGLLGRRIERKLSRHYAGRVFATLVSMTLRVPVYDSQCGAKLFRAGEETNEVFARRFLSRWIFDVEIIGRFGAIARSRQIDLGEMVVELPLLAWRDIPGTSVKVRHGVRALYDLLRIRRHLKRS